MAGWMLLSVLPRLRIKKKHRKVACPAIEQVGYLVHLALLPFFFLARGRVTGGLRSHSSHGMGAGPLLCCLNGSRLVILPALGHIVGKRVIRIRGTEQGLDREQDRSDLEGRGPVIWIIIRNHVVVPCKEVLTLQDIETDATQAVNVRVIDLGQEADLGGCHRIVVWEEKFQPKDST